MLTVDPTAPAILVALHCLFLVPQQYQVVFEGDDPSKKPDKYLRKDGKAAAKFANDDTYVGEYLNGKRHGHGVYTFAGGARYEGQYADGVKNGQGTLLHPDGSVYTGSWRADKRDGLGRYQYANGDSYDGEWKADKKHGRGRYSYKSSGSAVEGQWSNGQLMHGNWSMADGGRFTGAWHKNQPAGLGLHVFANGTQAAGRYVIDRKLGYKWTTASLVPANAASATADGASAVRPAAPLAIAQRFVSKCVAKADQFEGIHRLKKEVEGVPNLRRIGELPIFACGQPTRTGLQSLAEWAGDHPAGGVDKFLWVCLRAEPVVYVNEHSYVPRSIHALSAPLSLRGLAAAVAAASGGDDEAAAAAAAAAAAEPEPLLSAEDLAQVETSLAAKLTADISRRGNMHSYLKDAYTDHPWDRRQGGNIELSEEVALVADEDTGVESFGQAISTPTQVFASLAEEGGIDLEYKRVPLPSGRWPSGPAGTASIDALVSLIKSQDPGTALVFSDQMGRGRATLATILATLMRRTGDALASADERDAASGLGRTDIEGLEVPEYDESDPNIKLGQYALIMRLVRALSGNGGGGEQLKAEVDDAIDRCKSMHSVRESIAFAKEMHDREMGAGSPARAHFWRGAALDSLERYAMLMLFQAFVKANVESEYEAQSFAQFLDEKKEIVDEIVGDRKRGPLAEFKWQ